MASEPAGGVSCENEQFPVWAVATPDSAVEGCELQAATKKTTHNKPKTFFIRVSCSQDIVRPKWHENKAN